MGTLNEDLVAIKAVEDTIIANKVAKFAYTDEAYTNNDADGVTAYNVNNAQNIPTADPSILKVNETILNKGWRAQASSITRMLMNHFLGRLSYNLNKVNDNVSNLIATLISHRGTANGLATLDANGHVPVSQLPELDWGNAYYIICFRIHSSTSEVQGAGAFTIPEDGMFVPITIPPASHSSSVNLKNYLDVFFLKQGITIKQYINIDKVDESGYAFNTAQRTFVRNVILYPTPVLYIKDAEQVNVINLSVRNYPLGDMTTSPPSGYKIQESAVELRQSVFKKDAVLTPETEGTIQVTGINCSGLLFVPFKK